MRINSRKNEGITLIALIVTIVVLLILAGISIAMLTEQNGILTQAQRAKEETDKASEKEAIGLAYNSLIAKNKQTEGITANELKVELEKNGRTDVTDVSGDNQIAVTFSSGRVYEVDENGNIREVSTSVSNPYEEDWDYAWVCNNGIWENNPRQKGTEVKGDIVAKFYATDNTIQPPELLWNNYTIPFKEGTEYHLVIEGKGNMGAQMETNGDNIISASGYQTLSANYLMKYITSGENSIPDDFCIIPYVTEITICDGITNIGGYAFSGATSLNRIIISNDIKTIDEYSFLGCSSIENIRIPNEVEKISVGSFALCTNLNSITIPNSVTKIGETVFYNCTSLSNITYNGTKEEWNKINLSEEWKAYSWLGTVTCTDEVISL